jgi:hypothetical protein
MKPRAVRVLSEKPERDFAPPPPTEVVWVVVDQDDTFNRREALAQTAYRAYELSGIMRDGQRLSYSQCHVFHSEHLTKKLADSIGWGLRALCSRPPPPKLEKKTKSNGKANGHAG